jgi:hypothetical protein
MHVNNIKKFLKERINKELNLGILHRLYEELYQISKTEKDYIFLFEKLMDNNCDQHTYSSLKLLSMISIKISKEQEAYNQILGYSKKSPDNITILSILSIMETIDSVKTSSNYYNLRRDIHIFDIPKTQVELSPQNIIKYIEGSSKEHFEPTEQSVSKGSVFFLKKQINKNLDEFVNQVLKYFRKAQLSIIHNSPCKVLSSDLSKVSFWAVKIKSGGSMEPHYHPKGLLSGVIYLDVDKDKSGNFIIGSSPSAMEDNDNEKVIQISNMRLIIFPSYYFHRTKFNLSNKNRFSMSFDLTS